MTIITTHRVTKQETVYYNIDSIDIETDNGTRYFVMADKSFKITYIPLTYYSVEIMVL